MVKKKRSKNYRPVTKVGGEGKTICVNFFAGAGARKCFKKGTKVLMYDGSVKSIENIKNGNLLMGNNSTPRKVLQLSSGYSNMYEISPTKGDSFTVTGNHILPLKFNHHGEEKEYNITVDDFLKQTNWKKKYSKLYRTGVDFKYKQITLNPYFLGLWLGDGNKCDQRITTMDHEIIDFLTEYAVENKLILKQHSHDDEKAEMYSISSGRKGTSNIIMNRLRSYNLINNKHIPIEFLTNDRECRLQLLAGIIDSDGSVYRDGRGISLTLKDNKLSNDVLYLIRSLGFASYITKQTKRIKSTGFTGIYNSMEISGDLSQIPTRVKRKQTRKRRQVKNVLRTGFTVKPVEIMEYYGFETDGNHLFLLSDFTVVHNSTTAVLLHGILKMHGITSEYTGEYAKDLAWEGRLGLKVDQMKLFGEQSHKQWRLNGQVDIIISDSPLLLSSVYRTSDTLMDALILQEHNKYENINFYLERPKQYIRKGRKETKDEAIKIDEKIKKLLGDKQIPHTTIGGNVDGINLVIDIILEKLNIKKTYKICKA